MKTTAEERANYRALMKLMTPWERRYHRAAWLPYRWPFRGLKLWLARKAGYLS